MSMIDEAFEFHESIWEVQNYHKSKRITRKKEYVECTCHLQEHQESKKNYEESAVLSFSWYRKVCSHS